VRIFDGLLDTFKRTLKSAEAAASRYLGPR